MHVRSFARLFAMLAIAVVPLPTIGQAFPSKPIHLVVAYAAGTTTDLLARQLSQEAAALLGQPIVVENRPGASGTIGTVAVARAAPDGYMLAFGTILTHASNVSLMRDLPYDPIKDFTAISPVASQPQVLVVHPGIKAKSVAELVALAKAQPNKLNFASTGNGTGAHLSGEAFKSAAGIDIVHVPYNTAQVFVDLLAGNTSMMFYPYLPIKGYIDAGQLIPLATTGRTRVPWLPNVPTMIEAGYPEFVFSSWFALYGPAGMPEAVVSRINAAYQKVLADPGVRARLAASGTEPHYGGPADLAAFTASEIARLRTIVSRSGVRIE